MAWPFYVVQPLYVVWSLDGETIATISQLQSLENFTVDKARHTYISCIVQVNNIASGTTLSPVTLWSDERPYLWAQDKSFQLMTATRDGEACTIDISVVGSTLYKIKSFQVQPRGQHNELIAFCPATYQISISFRNGIHILDVQNSECLLEEEGYFYSNCFSPDGSLFAACQSENGVQIWKYIPSHYTPWRKIPGGNMSISSTLQFSPTLLSIMGNPFGILQVWHLDGPSIATHPKNHKQLAVISCCSAYIATCYKGDSTVTITNLCSQTTSQFIDTEMEVKKLFLTCNILLVLGCGMITAWHLTEEGVVDGVFGNRGADCSDAIWTVPAPPNPVVQVVDQSVIISDHKIRIPIWHAYHIETGEVLERAQISKLPSHPSYSSWVELPEPYHLHCHKLKGNPPKADCPVSWDSLKKGWVEDSEGRHLLWIPTEWRVGLGDALWCYKVRTLQLCPLGGVVAIVF